MLLPLVGLLSASAAAVHAATTTSYTYGDEEVVIQDPSSIVYGCADVRNHTRYTGHDVGGDPTPGVSTETLQDCCALCNADPKCAHITYNVGACYMKTNAVGPAEPVEGPQISASRVGPLPPPPPPTPPYSGRLPNLVFLIVESTDGRTYHEDSDAYMVRAAAENIVSLSAPYVCSACSRCECRSPTSVPCRRGAPISRTSTAILQSAPPVAPRSG